MDLEKVGETDRSSILSLAVLASLGIAAAALILAALKGGPYLSLDFLNPWLVVFAAGIFAAFAALPFAFNEKIVASDPKRTEAWERAMLFWGLIILPVFLLAVALVFAGGFSPQHSLADAAGVVLLIEAGLIELSLVAWLLAG